MVGVGRQLFVPLSLAVGFAMISSYLLSSTLVPVLSTWLMRSGARARRSRRGASAASYADALPRPGAAIPLAGGGAYRWSRRLLLWLLVPAHLATEIFPPSTPASSSCGCARPPARASSDGVDGAESLDVIKQEVGPDNVDISTGFIGVQPASYPINTIYLWTSGPHEAVLLVALKPGRADRGEALKERLRAKLRRELCRSARSHSKPATSSAR